MHMQTAETSKNILIFSSCTAEQLQESWFHPVRQLRTVCGWDLPPPYNDFEWRFLKECPEMENWTCLNAELTTDLPLLYSYWAKDIWTCLQKAAEKKGRKGIRITWDYSSLGIPLISSHNMKQ